MVERTRERILLSYDSEADVLYLSVGKPDRSARTNEDKCGMLWRISPAGSPQGVTILAFNQNWATKSSELVEILSDKLGLEPKAVKNELSKAY